MNSYFDPKQGFVSAQKLSKKLNVPLKETQKYVSNEDVYQVTRKVQPIKEFRKIIVNNPLDQWQLDLTFLDAGLTKDNKGFHILLCAIDCFTRFAYAIPLKNKSSKEIVSALKEILKKQKPKKIQTDKGSEFLNSEVKAYLKTLDIELFTTHDSARKAAMVERFNRTIKEMMFRYMIANDTNTWIDVIDDLVDNYNNTFHRSIKMTPAEATIAENRDLVYETLYDDYFAQVGDNPAKYDIGDTVRVATEKLAFTKGYKGNWSTEIFEVSAINETIPITYRIRDAKDEELTGSFYAEELQKVNKKLEKLKEDEWIVEKVSKETKMVKKVKHVKVKFVGYRKWYWIPEDDIRDL